MSDYDDYEYNPCIRKGKHKPKHKKQKNYIAKVQRMHPQEGKYVYNDYALFINDRTQYNQLVALIKSLNWKNWTDDDEHLYQKVYKLYEVPELKVAYDNIQRNIAEDELAFQQWYNEKEEEDCRCYWDYRRWGHW